MLSVKNLEVSYGNKHVLKDISIDIKQGQFVSILGSNGSGKSTLIKSIANFIKSKNSITLEGRKIEDLKTQDIFKTIAFLPQFNIADESIRVYDLIKFGREPHKNILSSLNNEDHKIIENIMHKLNLTQFKDELIGNLSGGEKQRVFLAQKLVQNPKILILDEPTNHLDINYQYQILNIINEYKLTENLTVICVLHDINQALKYSDHMVVIKSGQIYNQGSVEEVLSEEMIKDVFDMDVIIYNDQNHGYHVDYIV